MFLKKVFYKKAEKWIKQNGWEDISNKIPEILFKYRLEEIPYKPKYLVVKENIPFYLNFFQKGDWKYARTKFNGQACTGFDLYKYRFLEYLQAKTYIQAGLVMHSETTDQFVFRQLDQLPKPQIWFGNMVCRAYELRPKYNDVAQGFKCAQCWEKYPEIGRQCRKRNYPGAKSAKKREMVMWPLTEFSDEFIIQTKLF